MTTRQLSLMLSQQEEQIRLDNQEREYQQKLAEVQVNTDPMNLKKFESRKLESTSSNLVSPDLKEQTAHTISNYDSNSTNLKMLTL